MSWGRLGSRLAITLLLIAAVLRVGAGLAVAADARTTARDAGSAGDSSRADIAGDASDAAVVDADTAALLKTAARVRALVSGTLAAEVSAETLFDVPLDDARGVAVEVERLRALLREVDAAADAGRARKPTAAALHDATADAALPLPEDLWGARVALDRARFAFYSLPLAARAAAMAAHEKKQQEARAAHQETDAERRVREAEQERQRALEAARQADTEAERVVTEEYARLLGVARAQAAFASKLEEKAAAVTTRREASLKWQRRVRELREAKAVGQAADADSLYDELRATLRASRDALDGALDATTSGDVPQAGPDPLEELHLGTDQTRAQRKKAEAEALLLEEVERRTGEEGLAQLLEETTTLNRERLSLLPFLSSAKRDAVTGFTEPGRDQAASELRQLTLILRYHKHVAANWLRALRGPTQQVGMTAARSALVLVEWAVVAVAFFWWRRRANGVLEAMRDRIRDEDRRARVSKPSRSIAALGFAMTVRGPLEWLLLVLALGWLLPTAVRTILEVELLVVVLTWTLASRVVVNGLDNLASAGALARLAPDAVGTPGLRHRSLGMVGRVVVIFGVVLVLSARLVGQGTIYSWILSTCWFASIPVFLILIRWWRHVVYARLALVRKPSRFEAWVLTNTTGWTSFFAASAGGLYLFVNGGIKATRGWVSRFEVSRKAMAYLFRRKLDKLGAETQTVALSPLSGAPFDALGPEAALPGVRIEADLETRLGALIARLRARRGGIVALVGERGMGKTTSLRFVHAEATETALVATPAEGLVALRGVLSELAGLPHDATMDAIAEKLAGAETRAVMLDDFQRFVQPVMGGLGAFDAVLEAASRHSAKTTWVFAIDEVMWQFLERARAARPVFDEIIRLDRWREEDIASLLRARTEKTGLAPSFEHLLDQLPANADEIDRREALEARAESYYRLIWDNAAGNPGVALDMWRRSLGVDAAGKTFVRVFQTLDLADLERLPDASVFVLRAVLQLAPATPDAIVRATRVRAADVQDALRYALARGYLEESHGRFRVTWTWLRPTTLFLQRRHLLVPT